MKQITIEAQSVRVGDLIWWPRYYAKRGAWLRVNRLEPAAADNHINIHVGGPEPYVTFICKHRREGIAVQREETT
jgi:hypothetical protein